jgi:hypothetical protein
MIPSLVQWLTPIILAVWDSEMGRIIVWDQPVQEKFTRPPFQQQQKNWCGGNVPVIPATMGRLLFMPAQA